MTTSLSTRIAIPPLPGGALTLDQQREYVERLGSLNSPLTLPPLAGIAKRTPRRGHIFDRLLWSHEKASGLLFFTTFSVLVGLAWVAATYLLILRGLTASSTLPWVQIWGMLGLVFGAIILLGDKLARSALHWTRPAPDPAWPLILRVGLIAAHLALAILGAFWILLGLAAVLLPILVGVAWAVEAIPRVDLAGLISTLNAPQVQAFLADLTPGAKYAIAAVLALLLGWRAHWLPLLLLAVAGAAAMLPSLSLDAPLEMLGAQVLAGDLRPFLRGDWLPWQIVLTMCLAFLYPLQLYSALAQASRAPWQRWATAFDTFLRTWRLRRSLDLALRVQAQRNRAAVGQDGAHAVCKNHLRVLERAKAGPVTCWACRICGDDTPAYTGVYTVRGVLDTAMTAAHDQVGQALRLNLNSWDSREQPMLPLPLQEVWVGQLADPHDVEAFMTRYHTLQLSHKTWPSLRQIRCLIGPNSNLEEHARRQIQNNFAAMTIVAGR